MNLKLIILFILFSTLFFSCQKENSQKKIGLQVLGGVEREMIPAVQTALSDVYEFNVVILPEKKLPKNAFINVKSPRYRADILLKYLKTIKPDSIDYILGLTSKDISFTKKDAFGRTKKPESKYKDWGIMGLGTMPGSTCVVSTFRIKLKNKKKFRERFEKICVHEIGHNLGLKHCSYADNCVMRDAAETVRTIDKVDLALCDRCKNKANVTSTD